MTLLEKPLARILAGHFLKSITNLEADFQVQEAWEHYIMRWDEVTKNFTDKLLYTPRILGDVKNSIIMTMCHTVSKFSELKNNKVFMEWLALHDDRRTSFTTCLRAVFHFQNNIFSTHNTFANGASPPNPAFLLNDLDLPSVEQQARNTWNILVLLQRAFFIDIENANVLLYKFKHNHDDKNTLLLSKFNSSFNNSSKIKMGRALFFVKKSAALNNLHDAFASHCLFYLCFSSRDDLKHQLECALDSYFQDHTWPNITCFLDLENTNPWAISSSKPDKPSKFTLHSTPSQLESLPLDTFGRMLDNFHSLMR